MYIVINKWNSVFINIKNLQALKKIKETEATIYIIHAKYFRKSFRIYQ